MHISKAGLRLIEGFEGFSSKPYWDPFGSVWTRGFGETEGIHSGSPWISRAQGEANLKRLVEQRYEPAIRALRLPFNQNQWDALCSFVWNLGSGIFTGSLRQTLEARQWRAAAMIMEQYDHAGGQVLSGLQRRRREEMALFLKPVPAPPYIPHDEAVWRNEWAKLKGVLTWRAHKRRVVLKQLMTKRRKAIYIAATRQHNGWRILNRYDRYQVLKRYTK
jgi:lysozyme